MFTGRSVIIDHSEVLLLFKIQGCFRDDHDFWIPFFTAKTYQMAKIAISAFALGASFATYPNDIRLKFDEMQDGVQGFCNWLIVIGKRSNKKCIALIIM